MDEGGAVTQICIQCQTLATFTISDNGFYHCSNCNFQADDIFDVGVDDAYVTYNNTQSRRLTQTQETQSQTQETQFTDFYETKPVIHNDNAGDVDFTEPSDPRDFGGFRKEFGSEVVSSSIRARYLNGLRVMIQLQCEALVEDEEIGVSPLVVGLIGSVWLRFLVVTKVTGDDWADIAVDDDEAKTEKKGEVEGLIPCGSDAYCARFGSEHFSIHKKRLVMIWFRSLASKVPVSCTLAITFLVCHVAREAVLPTDVLKWALEGKLPYLSASGEIRERLGQSPDACPISDRRMFRPVQLISTQKLEAEAAKIAEKIGLALPPVNFYAIASRYCSKLSLPTTKKILDTACQICEWCAPPELYLSSNEFRIPTRVYAMSVLVVAIRIIFNINGYGFWESSLSDTSSCSRGRENEGVEPQCHSSADDEVSGSENLEVRDSNLNAGELLQILEAKYNELDDVCGFASDLSSYIKNCEDVVFSEHLETNDNFEDKKLWTEFRKYYQNNKDDNCYQDDQGGSASCSRQSPETESSHKDTAIRRMKLEMEEKKFWYVPPRTRVKREAYLHYARKKRDVLTYAVHADYYILLRSCATVAQVETRVMHTAVLSFERRLNWLEKKMDDSLNLTQNLDSFCDYCRDEP